MKAARRAHRRAHLAGLHLGDEIQDELRQLRALAPAELAAVERGLAVRVGDRELAEVLTLGGARRDVVGLLGDVLELLGRGGLRQRQKDVRDVELIVRRRRLLAREILIELVRRDVDVGDHVALPQGAQGELLAHALAILLVIDALGGERGRQLVERDLVALGDLLQGAVELLVRDGQADVLGPLRLDLLQDQPLEHLLAQHALRGKLHFLFLQPLGHRIHLLVELALEHQAFVHDGRDAVEQLAVGADIPGLCRRAGTGQECRHEESAKDRWVSHKIFLLGCRLLLVGPAGRVSADLFGQERVRPLSDRGEARQFQL